MVVRKTEGERRNGLRVLGEPAVRRFCSSKTEAQPSDLDMRMRILPTLAGLAAGRKAQRAM